MFITHLHSDHITDLNDLVTGHWFFGRGDALRIWGPPGIREVVDGILKMLAADVRYRMEHHDNLNAKPNLVVTEVSGGAAIDLPGMSVFVGDTDHRPVAPTVAYRFGDGERSVVVAGDTVPCEGLDELCSGADALVQTVLRFDILQRNPRARTADIQQYHSSVEQAAQTAAKAGLSRLIMTHYVPPIVPGEESEWVSLAAEHFDGAITVGDDLTAVTI